MTKEEAILGFVNFAESEVAQDLDPNNEYIWEGVAAGYFFGLGFSPKECYEMAVDWYCR